MSTITKIAAVALIAFAVTGCSALKTKICGVQDTPETAFVTMKLPDSPPLTIDSIEWTIVTPENAQEKFNELKLRGIDEVFFGLTDKEYESKSINDEKTQGELLLLRDKIDQLEKYYSDLESRLNKTQK